MFRRLLLRCKLVKPRPRIPCPIVLALAFCLTFITVVYLSSLQIDADQRWNSERSRRNVAARRHRSHRQIEGHAFVVVHPAEVVDGSVERDNKTQRTVDFDAQHVYDITQPRVNYVRMDDRSKLPPRHLRLADAGNERRRNDELAAAYDVTVPPSCALVDPLKFWQLGGDVFVYSAYWDSRWNDFDNGDNGSFVRVMAVVRGRRPRLRCRWPIDGSAAAEGTFTDVSYYEMSENHNKPYGSFILSCRMPSHVTGVRCDVTLMADYQYSVTLPIRTLNPHSAGKLPKVNFTVCVPPLFGSISSFKIVEFLELTSLLGADRITIYYYNVSDEVQQLLTQYSASKCRPGMSEHCREVQVVPWPLPVAVTNDGIWNYGQSVAIHDCLYRNMATSNYVLFNDIDEFIVPHANGTFVWNNVIEKFFEHRPNWCALRFVSVIYRPDNKIPADASSVYHGSPTNALRTMSWLRRLNVASSMTAKILVKPLEIFEAGIHHISKPVFSTRDVLQVDQELAYLHHYRSCPRSETPRHITCRYTWSVSVEDKTMLRYRDALEQSVIDSSRPRFTSGLS